MTPQHAVPCEGRTRFAFLALGQLAQQSLGLVAAAGVEARGEDGDDLDHVLRQLLLKARRLALVDDDDLNVLNLAERDDQVRTKPQQPVLVGQHSRRMRLCRIRSRSWCSP